MNVPDADFWKDLEQGGIPANFIPIKVEEIPFVLKTDNPANLGYKLSESEIRPLVEAYMRANKEARPAILDQITEVVLKFHRDHNNAHYSSEQGQPRYMYLSPPNDSRNQFVYEQSVEGNKNINILELWMLEGRGKFPANILPGAIVVDSSTGKLMRTMAFDNQARTAFRNVEGQSYTFHVNNYTVDHDQNLTGLGFTSLGNAVFESRRFELNRVVNGILGVETKDIEKTSYSPFYSYPLFLHSSLVGDSYRLTAVPLYSDFKAGVRDTQGSSQNEDETALRDRPTARETMIY